MVEAVLGDEVLVLFKERKEVYFHFSTEHKFLTKFPGLLNCAVNTLFCVICTKIKVRFKALCDAGLGFVSTISSTTGLWLGLVPAQCRLFKSKNKEVRGGDYSAIGLNLVLGKGCGAAAGPARLFSHHLNTSNPAWMYNFLTLPLFSLTGIQSFGIRVLLQHL